MILCGCRIYRVDIWHLASDLVTPRGDTPKPAQQALGSDCNNLTEYRNLTFLYTFSEVLVRGSNSFRNPLPPHLSDVGSVVQLSRTDNMTFTPTSRCDWSAVWWWESEPRFELLTLALFLHSLRNYFCCVNFRCFYVNTWVQHYELFIRITRCMSYFWSSITQPLEPSGGGGHKVSESEPSTKV